MTAVGRALALQTIISLAALVPQMLYAGADSRDDWRSSTGEREYIVEGELGGEASGPGDAVPVSYPDLRQDRTLYCDPSAPDSDLPSDCVRVKGSFVAQGLACPEEAPGISASFFRTRASVGAEWSAWSWIDWALCVEPSGLLGAIRTEWESLTPTPPPLNLQPNTGWVYTTVPTIAFTDDTPMIHDATLLGVPVRIRATPSEFTWTWGDGTSTSTADAGSPYPDYSLSHTYLYREGEADVELETTWSGDYSVNGGLWIDITGSITTHTGPVTIEVLDPQSRLVDCDLNGDCLVGTG